MWNDPIGIQKPFNFSGRGSRASDTFSSKTGLSGILQSKVNSLSSREVVWDFLAHQLIQWILHENFVFCKGTLLH